MGIGKHWEYHWFDTTHALADGVQHVVDPVQPCPPHWPHVATHAPPLDVVGCFVGDLVAPVPAEVGSFVGDLVVCDAVGCFDVGDLVVCDAVGCFDVGDLVVCAAVGCLVVGDGVVCAAVGCLVVGDVGDVGANAPA